MAGFVYMPVHQVYLPTYYYMHFVYVVLHANGMEYNMYPGTFIIISR